MRRNAKKIVWIAAVLSLLLVTSHLAGNWLQHRNRQADASQEWDAVYLVCGAKAQHYRLRAMTHWLAKADHPPSRVLIGHDNQNSLWSRDHQRNLTRAEWAEVALHQWVSNHYENGSAPRIEILGQSSFSNTDGEMRVLASVLETMPDIQRLAIVTCRFHTRRALNRLDHYTPATMHINAVPGERRLFDRFPWIVAIEHMKLLRDTLGHSQTRFLSRPPAEPVIIGTP